MPQTQCLEIAKALADESRLKILKSLFEKPLCVEEIAKQFKLSSPTVSFHCKKLEQAGLVSKKKEQYYMMFQAIPDAFRMTLRDLVGVDEKQKKIIRPERTIVGDQVEKQKISVTPAGNSDRDTDEDGYDGYCTIRW